MSEYVQPNSGSNSGPVWHVNTVTVIRLSFAGLGLLALLAPVFATTTTVVFLAATMLFWGSA